METGRMSTRRKSLVIAIATIILVISVHTPSLAQNEAETPTATLTATPSPTVTAEAQEAQCFRPDGGHDGLEEQLRTILEEPVILMGTFASPQSFTETEGDSDPVITVESGVAHVLAMLTAGDRILMAFGTVVIAEDGAAVGNLDVCDSEVLSIVEVEIGEVIYEAGDIAAKPTSEHPLPRFKVAREEVNVRQGPGTSSPIIGKVYEGMQFDIVGQSQAGDWYNFCCVNDKEGWIYVPLVQAENPQFIPAPTPQATSTAATSTTAYPRIGEDVRVKNVRWRVLDVKDLGNELKSNSLFFDDATTRGRFIRVRFEVENMRNTSLSPLSVNIQVHDNRGRLFNPYRKQSAFIPDDEDCTLFVTFMPNVPQVCTAIYEVAADAVGLTFIATDLEFFSFKEAAIDLTLPTKTGESVRESATVTSEETSTAKAMEDDGEKLGILLVGKDIAPGLYRGEIREDEFYCGWDRLSSLKGDSDSNSILYSEIFGTGKFYFEVLASDYAIETTCPVAAVSEAATPIENKSVEHGILLVGEDIAPGLYRWEMRKNESFCQWERLSGLKGDYDSNIILSGRIYDTGRFYVEVEEADYAVKFTCH